MDISLPGTQQEQSHWVPTKFTITASQGVPIIHPDQVVEMDNALIRWIVDQMSKEEMIVLKSKMQFLDEHKEEYFYGDMATLADQP